MERCFAFGKFIRQGLEAQGLTGVIVCSGGLSHFPGTPRYKDPGPCTEFDGKLMEILSQGNTRHLLSLDEEALDDTGNIELRCWGVAFGALEARKPDVVGFEPTWHQIMHDCMDGSQENLASNPIPPIHPERVLLSEICILLLMMKLKGRDISLIAKNLSAALTGFHMKKKRLIELNQIKFIQLGVHPFVSHALRMVQKEAILEPDGETS